MASFLSHKQSLDNVVSETGTVKYGVDQGFILRSLLFLLYINDIPQALSNSHTNLQAKNTSIFYHYKSRGKCSNLAHFPTPNLKTKNKKTTLKIFFSKKSHPKQISFTFLKNFLFSKTFFSPWTNLGQI